MNKDGLEWVLQNDAWHTPSGDCITKRPKGGYEWFSANRMGASGFTNTLDEAIFAVARDQRGEPAWMDVCRLSGELISFEETISWANNFRDSYIDPGDGCATYTLWNDGCVTLSHPESDTYLVWRKP